MPKPKKPRKQADRSIINKEGAVDGFVVISNEGTILHRTFDTIPSYSVHLFLDAIKLTHGERPWKCWEERGFRCVSATIQAAP